MTTIVLTADGALDALLFAIEVVVDRLGEDVETADFADEYEGAIVQLKLYQSMLDGVIFTDTATDREREEVARVKNDIKTLLTIEPTAMAAARQRLADYEAAREKHGPSQL